MIKRKIEAMHEAYGTRPNLCKDCAHFRRYMLLSRRTCLKCRAYGVTKSEATDWCANWTACGLFNQHIRPEQYVPMIDRLKHASHKAPDGPVDGQIEMEGLFDEQ